MSSQVNWSALGNCSADDVSHEPYAHIVRKSLYPDDVYQRMTDMFPADDVFFKHLPEIKNNQAVRIAASDVLSHDMFSTDAKAYFSYHTSDAFWQDIVTVFGESLRTKFPQLEPKIGRPMNEWRTKRRGEDGDAEINLDMLFVINSPVQHPSSVRTPHVDRRNKIFSGLFYMKQENDPTPGGDLTLYRFKNGHCGFTGHYASMEHLEERGKVTYEPNTFVGFVNSDDSIHGVTPRPKTEWVRRYINFVVEIPFNAFELQKLPVHQRFKSWMTRRKNKSPGVDIQLGA